MFSLTTEYALRSAVCLAERYPEMLTSQYIADVTQVPVRYLSKVLQTLAEAHLLTSQRGPSGGFALARKPSAVTLFDIVQAVDPIQRVLTCPLNLPEHEVELCPLHKTMDDLARSAEDHLRKSTLGDLIVQPIVPLGLSVRQHLNGDSHRNGAHSNGKSHNGTANHARD
ncbi:MAG: Rrf2 family transcriptional regulator [Phycisphaerales bacterium]|jgi:Rrf2 family protein|nr:Rrf2 family transcriptional regulator [Phycisphaerales bacterium]